MTNDTDLNERIERIKSSIARINELMSEIKEMNAPTNKEYGQ